MPRCWDDYYTFEYCCALPPPYAVHWIRDDSRSAAVEGVLWKALELTQVEDDGVLERARRLDSCYTDFLERVKTSKENTRKDESFDQLQALATTKALMRMSGLSDKPDALAGGAYKVPAAARLGGAKPPEEMESAAALAAAKANGSYVPIHLRAGSGAMGESMKTRRDENSIRVTNLSEDTKEQDLVELFRPFGPISRIYIAYDRDTRESRGFAFINFIHRDDADRAISKLDGYGYDNLILRVEWAAPREPKP